MKRLAACIACLGLASAMAAEPARLAEARAMMKSMEIEKQLEAMMNAMTTGMARQMNEIGGRGNPRVAQIAMEESAKMMRDRATGPGGLIEAMTEAYADEFSLDELRQIRAFHESPVGKHMLASAPLMMRRVMERTPIVTKDMIVKVCESTKARMESEKIAGAAPMNCAEAMK